MLEDDEQDNAAGPLYQQIKLEQTRPRANKNFIAQTQRVEEVIDPTNDDGSPIAAQQATTVTVAGATTGSTPPEEEKKFVQ